MGDGVLLARRGTGGGVETFCGTGREIVGIGAGVSDTCGATRGGGNGATAAGTTAGGG
jgi:hypothetical protein